MKEQVSLYRTDRLERAVYRAICGRDGIKAKDIAARVGADRTTVNRYLYKAPFMKELCYRDDDFLWHGLIRQSRPHIGLGDFAPFTPRSGNFWNFRKKNGSPPCWKAAGGSDGT